MFICTKNQDVANELNKQLELIQKVQMREYTLFVYSFNKDVYSKFSNKEIFISNKLFF